MDGIKNISSNNHNNHKNYYGDDEQNNLEIQEKAIIPILSLKHISEPRDQRGYTKME